MQRPGRPLWFFSQAQKSWWSSSNLGCHYASSRSRSTTATEPRDGSGSGGTHPSSLRDLTQPTAFSDLIVGCPRETSTSRTSLERRVALTPANASLLLKKGFQVQVAQDAGQLAGFSNEAYTQAGAQVVTQDALLTSTDVLLRVNRPDAPDVHQLKQGSTVISMLHPQQQHKDDPLLHEFSQRAITAFGLELIPRISRAQSFDVLSSMANIAGYKAVVEAANAFGRSINSATTAAGSTPPAKVRERSPKPPHLTRPAFRSPPFLTLLQLHWTGLGHRLWCGRPQCHHDGQATRCDRARFRHQSRSGRAVRQPRC